MDLALNNLQWLKYFKKNGINWTKPHIPWRFFFFFSFLTRSKYQSFRFLLFSLCWPQDEKFFFYLSLNTRFGFLAGTWWPFVSRNPREFYYVPFFCTDSGLHIYHLVVWSNFNSLHNSQGITFHNQLFSAFVHNEINCFLYVST